MTELSIEYDSSPVRVIPVPATAVDQLLITADCELYGFSLRDATGDVPARVEGSVTSPGAGGVIAQLALLPRGEWVVSWTVELIGAAAAADQNNFQLTSGGGQNFVSVNPGAAGQYPQPSEEITTTAAATVQISAIAAGTVGVTYAASFSLEPVAQGNTVVELQDGNNPLAELSLGAGLADSRWYGRPGLHVRNQVNLHMLSGIVTGAVYVKFKDSTG